MGYEGREEQFKTIIREMLSRGTYPDNASVKAALGTDVWPRSGLSQSQVRWRIEEMERAGFDWEASKARRTLIKVKERR